MPRPLSPALFFVLSSMTGFVACAASAPEPEPRDQGRCAEAWGAVPTEGDRVWVDREASPDGDGSLERPFDELASAFEVAQARPLDSIAIAAGDYAGNWQLSEGFRDGWSFAGLRLVGCGSDETTLEGDPDNPVLDIFGADTQGTTVAHLSVVGGRRGVVVRAGAGSDRPIALEDVVISEALRVGLLVDGTTSRVDAVDVRVIDPQPEDGRFGWGIAVQSRAEHTEELPGPSVFEGGGVSGASEVGFVVDGGWVDLTAVTVEDTRSLAGVLGRGVQYQRRSAGTLDGVVSRGNADAAVHLHKPGRLDGDVTLRDSTMQATLPADIPGGADQASDGLSVSQEQDGQDPATFVVRIEGSTFEGNSRAHLVAEDVTVQLGGDNIFGKGTTHPIVEQGDAALTGLDGAELAGVQADLVTTEPVGLNRGALTLDELVD